MTKKSSYSLSCEHLERAFEIAYGCELQPAFATYWAEERSQFMSSVSTFSLRSLIQCDEKKTSLINFSNIDKKNIEMKSKAKEKKRNRAFFLLLLFFLTASLSRIFLFHLVIYKLQSSLFPFNIMTTKRKNQSNTQTQVRSFNPPPVFNIQYPNSRTGMFSLRAPFKDSSSTNQSQQDIFTRTVTPEIIHPEYLHQDQSKICFFFIRSRIDCME